MITEPCELLIESGKPPLQLLSGIVVVPVQASQLGLDVLMQLGVVSKAEQVVLDQVEDVILDEISRDGVPLRAFVLVALLVA